MLFFKLLLFASISLIRLAGLGWADRSVGTIGLQAFASFQIFNLTFGG